MKKYIIYFCIGFAAFLMVSIIVFVFCKREKNNLEEIELSKNEIVKIVDKVLEEEKWYDITENDKITLAFSSETDTISFIRSYLKDNKVAIFYVYGGPFDAKMNGNYIICTGFDKSGMAKIYYSNDNYEKEYLYSFESMLEFSHKVLTFNM